MHFYKAGASVTYKCEMLKKIIVTYLTTVPIKKGYYLLCYVMLCYVMLCYVMLCYVMLLYSCKLQGQFVLILLPSIVKVHISETFTVICRDR